MGIATQNPDLRAKFKGKPDDVVNFMTFIARDVREQLAKLGLRSLDELVGRSDLLHQVDFRHGIDLSALLSNPLIEHNSLSQNHQLHKSFDQTVLLPLYKKALSKGLPLKASFPLKNTQRVVGTQLGSEITRIHGAKGLSPDTFSLQFTGSAGQSFGAFIPQGLSLHLVGQANDYVGKGLSGGTIVVQTPNALHPQAHRHSLIGNVAFFGASSGKAFINGCAGERFCVRNSGATVVVEGVGNHACEYMTNGCVVILGDFGYNLAAGMSGGLAYVYDPKHLLAQNTNLDMVDLVELEEMDALKLKALVDEHVLRTDSVLAKTLLQDWDESLKKFIKVYPKDYHRVMDQIQHFQDEGHAYTEAVQLAFNESK